MNKKTIFCLVLCALFAQPALANKVYKCKNAQGGVSYQDSPCTQSNQSVSSWSANKNTARTMTLTPRDGHYSVDGQVNGQNLVFTVDTSASFVVIPQAMAATAQLSCQGQASADASNGGSGGCTTTINSLTFGPFNLRAVHALLLPNATQPLLGMNVLRQLNMTQDNGEMRLTTK